MKKGLSVLLIVAALFGFYGGAVNLQDVLACMHYWEKEGEKSTADMNKLEDGLKQLQDNEQAYLDGKDQLAEGEKTLADGEAQYAQGLADYAAAPGKLAAGKQKIEDGEEALDGLTKLINGIATIRNGYNKEWKPGYDKLADGRKEISTGLSKATLAGKPATAVLAGMSPLTGNAAGFVAAVNAVANDTGKDQTYDGYVTYTTNCKTMKNGIDKIEAAYKAGQGLGAQVKNAIPENIDADEMEPYRSAYAEKIAGVLGMSSIPLPTGGSVPISTCLAMYNKPMNEKGTTGKDIISGALDSADATTLALLQSSDAVKTLRYGLGEMTKALDGGSLKDLKDGQDTIAGGIATVATAVLGNKTLKAGVKSKMGKKAITLLKAYRSSNGPLSTKVSNFATFEKQMDETPGLNKWLAKAQKLLVSTRASGKKTLAAGKATYAQGLKDYAAAPAKLADAEKQLADGRKQLEDGKAQLAQYEDGEQQVRDGLATLMSTEPSGGLESILDRRNGDDDFDNGDEHLDLAEGLEAVDVGRGYQADSGDLITVELVKRGAGTAAGIAAGVLALLAALLSFLKKNKGAAISACIAAIAAAGGAAVGTSAGTEFSVQAGSAVGVLPWAAAGVLAAVAVVFAVVHFSAPKEAK